MSYKVRAAGDGVNVTAVIARLVTEALYKSWQMQALQVPLNAYTLSESVTEYMLSLSGVREFAQQRRDRTNALAREMLPSA